MSLARTKKAVGAMLAAFAIFGTLAKVATVATQGLDLGAGMAYGSGMATIKLTKLESFVWNNPHVAFDSLATQTNRTVSSIERAYDRAKRKADIAARANVVKPFDYSLTVKA